MFDFADSGIPIRNDIPSAFRAEWAHLATPGAVLSSRDRIALAGTARSATESDSTHPASPDASIASLASLLMGDPGAVEEATVRPTADTVGDPATVEAIAIVSRLSAVDGFHRALGLPLEPLPDPIGGQPTGEITPGLKRRRTHVPMPPGPIPVSLDLVPSEGVAMEALAGPLYMTYADMAYADFARDPGLNRAQMELISSRTSHRNACFY